jgi:hypothetical protein
MWTHKNQLYFYILDPSIDNWKLQLKISSKIIKYLGADLIKDVKTCTIKTTKYHREKFKGFK